MLSARVWIAIRQCRARGSRDTSTIPQYSINQLDTIYGYYTVTILEGLMSAYFALRKYAFQNIKFQNRKPI